MTSCTLDDRVTLLPTKGKSNKLNRMTSAHRTEIAEPITTYCASTVEVRKAPMAETRTESN